MKSIVMLLLFLPLVFAGETLESTLEVADHGIIEDLTGTQFTLGITGINEGEKIVLKGKETQVNGSVLNVFMWLELDQCDVYRLTRFCFTDSDNSSGKWIATIDRYNLSESISFDVTITDGSVYRGEHIIIDVTLTNDGYSAAKNLSLFLYDMTSFEIISDSSFRKNGTHLYQEYNTFHGDSSEEYEFILATSQLDEVPLTIGVRFMDRLGAWKEAHMGPIIFNISDFFNYSFTFDPTNLGIDTYANLSVFLHNNFTNDYVYVSKFEVEYPPILTFVDAYRISQPKTGLLTYKSNFTYNVTRLPTAAFRAVAPGRGNITLRMEYLLGSIPTTTAVHTETFPFSILSKKILIRTNVESNYIHASGDQIPLVVEVNNPYHHMDIHVSKVVVGIGDTSHILVLNEIVQPSTHKVVINTSLSLPQVQQDLNLSMNVTVEFETEFLQEILTTNYTLLITREALEIQHLFSAAEFTSGQIYNLTVMVYNPSARAFTDLEVSSLSEFDGSFNETVLLSLLPGETKMAYSTLLHAPFITQETELSHATLIEDTQHEPLRIYLNESKILVHPVLDSVVTSVVTDTQETIPVEPSTSIISGETSTAFPQVQTAFSASYFWSFVGVTILAIVLVAGFLFKQFAHRVPETPPMVEVQRAIQEAQQLPSDKNDVDVLLSQTEEKVKK